jgi:NTE family protein
MRAAAVLLAALVPALAGCALTIDATPVNRAAVARGQATPQPARNIVGEHVVALSFSGGGLRAAAFSFGVLQALQQSGEGVLGEVALVSSVSGGSLTAAYFGLEGEAGLADYRERVLLRDMERGMRMSAYSPENLLRMMGGGINDRSNLANWLDKEVFRGATFADLYRRGKPDVWINATDLYNRTPFPFIPPMFNALCSDLASFPVAEAVHASMAVPLVFSPVVLKTYPGECADMPAPWLDRVAGGRSESLILGAAARAVRHYRDPKVMRYVKLVDGGVTDNYGLSSILISRAASTTGYGPMTARDAVRVRRLLFLVVDAGRRPAGEWALELAGPSGFDVAIASTDSAIDAASRLGFEAFRQAMADWRTRIVAFRCGLTRAQLDALRGETATPWQCDDVQIDLGLLSFDDLGPQRADALNGIDTRLTLPAAQIDAAIDGGRDAALQSPALKRYLNERLKGGR